ncbi:FUSC family protein [Streptomyces sp. SD15]
MSWLRALNATARSGLRIERKRLEPLIAVRGAAGLALVIGLSLWAFGPAVAASSAFGAFQAAIATFQRSWRPRPELALASGASLAVSTFVGYVTISHLALFLALLVVWTFLSGMSWAAGPTAGLIASSNVAIMLVTVTLPTSVAQAAGHSAMMIVGGLVQASLVVLFPVRRWGAHRDALADALAAEADYARRLRHDPVAPFDPLPLMEARDAAAVTPRQARRRPAELHGPRGLAERIRPVLASLADPAMGVPSDCPQRDRVNELLAAAAAILDGAARAIRHGTPVDLPPGAVAAFRTPDTEAILTGPPYRAATRLGTLLQDVVETAGGRRYDVAVDSAGAVMGGTGAAVGRPGETGAAPLLRPTFIGLIPVALRAMREELHRDSPIYRHAIRVSAVAAAGYLLGTWLPLGHGYWAPLASVMIMRPDFSQTYSRAVARFCGTLVGVALATGIVQVAHPGTYLSGALAVISAALMYLLLRTSQMAAQAFIAAYVVFLLGMGGEQWTQTVPERVLLTLLGGLLAMLAYALYPAWETPRLRGRLADWLAAQGRYASAVLSRYANPAGAGPQPTADRATTPGLRAPATPNPEDDGRGHAPAAPDPVREALLGSRTARAAWHAAVERATNEPVRHRGLSRTAADDAEDALARMGRVAMLMEAHLPERDAAPVPAAARFAEALRKATEQGAKSVRERRVPRWDPVREALEAWDGEGPRDALLRRGAGMILQSLVELSEALDTAVPPMTVDGHTNGPRNPKDSAAHQ